MSSHPTEPVSRKPITLPRLREMHAKGEKIVMLTAYDASFAALGDQAGVDCLLVGDSLGMVMQGKESTVPVTLAEMAYHTRCVAAARTAAWVIGDLPFGSYHESPAQAYASARTLMQAGAQMVKLEGGGWTAETVDFLVQRGVPVCAHLGLTPQSVSALGGYKIQGRTDDAQTKLIADARALQNAGAAMLVVELVPSATAQALTQALSIPVIGIGAGNATGGQVLVLQDMLGITSDAHPNAKLPRFVKNYMAGASSIKAAIEAYVAEVRSGSFPDNAVHGYER